MKLRFRRRQRPPDLYDFAQMMAPEAVIMANRYGPVFCCPTCPHREAVPHRINAHIATHKE